MEPMNATRALDTPERCEVWTPTQNGEAALAAPPRPPACRRAKCEVYKMHLGGGFGRRGADTTGCARRWHRQGQMPGTPVKLIWSAKKTCCTAATTRSRNAS
jgi:isoquinoline 1-oxidoreductase beta subunit